MRLVWLYIFMQRVSAATLATTYWRHPHSHGPVLRRSASCRTTPTNPRQHVLPAWTWYINALRGLLSLLKRGRQPLAGTRSLESVFRRRRPTGTEAAGTLTPDRAGNLPEQWQDVGDPSTLTPCGCDPVRWERTSFTQQLVRTSGLDLWEVFWNRNGWWNQSTRKCKRRHGELQNEQTPATRAFVRKDLKVPTFVEWVNATEEGSPNFDSSWQ